MSDRPISEATRNEVTAWSAGLLERISENAAVDIAQRFGLLYPVQHGQVNAVRDGVDIFKGHPSVGPEDRRALSALLDFSSQGGRY